MHALERLAPLFAYPDASYANRALLCAREIDSADLQGFAAQIAAMPVTAQQELFVQTFDMNPASTLEIGWHLFGEQYERGAFLVELRDRLRSAGIPETGELPDHLVHVLPLVARMDPPDAAAFSAARLAPALEKIALGLPEGNPFGGLLRATRTCAASLTASGN
jgi:nitrate reductase delta subunit